MLNDVENTIKLAYDIFISTESDQEYKHLFKDCRLGAISVSYGTGILEIGSRIYGNLISMYSTVSGKKNIIILDEIDFGEHTSEFRVKSFGGDEEVKYFRRLSNRSYEPNVEYEWHDYNNIPYEQLQFLLNEKDILLLEMQKIIKKIPITNKSVYAFSTFDFKKPMQEVEKLNNKFYKELQDALLDKVYRK